MANQKGRLLARCQVINGCEYSIRVTKHALEQMEVRGVSGSDVVETIFALGIKRLLHLQKVSSCFCLINNRLNRTVILSMVKNRIIVLTVLAKAEQVFTKRGTWYIDVSNESSSLGKEVA